MLALFWELVTVSKSVTLLTIATSFQPLSMPSVWICLTNVLLFELCTTFNCLRPEPDLVISISTNALFILSGNPWFVPTSDDTVS